jgi:glycosyltransferase involved in cell wall biosynthesis
MTLHVGIVTDQYPSKEHPDRGTFIKDLVDQLRAARFTVTVIDHKINFVGMSLECMIRSAQVDVIDAQFLAPAGVVAALTPRIAPLVITIHRWDILEFPYRWPLGRIATAFALRTARGIIVAGSAVMPEVVKFAPSNARIAAIPNAVDTRRFRPDVDFSSLKKQLGIADGEMVILSAGHLIPRKGFEYAIKAMADIAKQFDSCRLVIVGDGYLREELQALKTKLQLGDKVKFAGAVNYDYMHYYYAMADIFVMPSLSEGHSLSILEAMAAGKPVVASAIPANAASVVSGLNGFLVPPTDSQAISSAILRLLRDNDLRRSFGLSSRDRAVKLFSWDHRITRLEDFYLSVLG